MVRALGLCKNVDKGVLRKKNRALGLCKDVDKGVLRKKDQKEIF